MLNVAADYFEIIFAALKEFGVVSFGKAAI